MLSIAWNALEKMHQMVITLNSYIYCMNWSIFNIINFLLFSLEIQFSAVWFSIFIIRSADTLKHYKHDHKMDIWYKMIAYFKVWFAHNILRTFGD
jgi:hypothetical protein